MQSTWLQATKEMTLPVGDVHVWYLDLNALPDCSLLACLSSEERERAARFKHIKAKTCYEYTYAVLRHILSRYVPVEPSDLIFEWGEHGKPYLLPVLGNPHRLQFNLSHAGDAVYYALTWQHEIGVDIECVDRRTQWADVAQRFFSLDEQHELFALPLAEQERGFYRGWTRKEAFMKATGKGLSYGLQNFSVGLASASVSHIYSIKDAHFSAFSWSLCSLMVPSDAYEAALVVAATLNTLQYYVFSTVGEF